MSTQGLQEMGASVIAFFNQNKKTAFIAAFIGIILVIIILAVNAMKQQGESE